MDTELIWAAGLYVGEGCTQVFQRRKKDGTGYVQLSIGMYDERAMNRFANAVRPYVPARRSHKYAGMRVNAYHTQRGEPPRNVIHHVVASTGGIARAICIALYPHLKDTDKGDQMTRAFRLAFFDDEELINARPL